MLVKICGITNIEDATNACEFGAWAIGYIFFKGSKRYVEPEKAGEISSKITSKKIGVFVNETIENIIEIANLAKLDIIQLHGDETVHFINELKSQINLEIIKAFRVKTQQDTQQIDEYSQVADYILLDSFDEKEYGGTGKAFNWDLAKQANQKDIRLILSGGINPDNIKQAIAEVNPFAIDVSSGVEKQKGLKDIDKLKELFR